MSQQATGSIPIEVRFADLDAYGHVNNAVYFTYLETARTRLFMDRFLALKGRDLLLLVARAECDYQKPIALNDRVIADVEIERVGRSSFDLAYTLHDGEGKTYATARTVMVCFDAGLGRTVEVPKELAEREE